jgi:MFS transporter, DHA3 family, macrolide efflux protein
MALESNVTETLPQKPSFRRVLSNRPFALLWAGQLVSQSGDFIFDVAAIWLVLQLTGNLFNVGLAFAMVLLPPIVIGPFAGVYIDKFNRRDVMLASNIFQAIVSGLIAFLYSIGLLSFPALLAFLFVLNAGAQFVRPAVTAIIPGVTRKEDLAAANGLFSMTSSVNQIAGYGIGGILVVALGPILPIYYDAFTFIFAAGMVSLIAQILLRSAEQHPGFASCACLVQRQVSAGTQVHSWISPLHRTGCDWNNSELFWKRSLCPACSLQ